MRGLLGKKSKKKRPLKHERFKNFVKFSFNFELLVHKFDLSVIHLCYRCQSLNSVPQILKSLLAPLEILGDNDADTGNFGPSHLYDGGQCLGSFSMGQEVVDYEDILTFRQVLLGNSDLI